MNKGPTLGAVIMILASVAVLLVLMFLYTTYAINASQHDWCSTLQLLTAHKIPKPSDPRANPSRENAYLFYHDFVSLRARLGCM